MVNCNIRKYRKRAASFVETQRLSRGERVVKKEKEVVTILLCEKMRKESGRERRFHAHAWRRLNYEAELVGWFYDYAGSRSSRTAYFLL